MHYQGIYLETYRELRNKTIHEQADIVDDLKFEVELVNFDAPIGANAQEPTLKRPKSRIGIDFSC